jgi:hypothetical protein|tara:strand:+ start:268 stop:1029 length:762 start_codon:yes stop_codon:yes gene_type:complete
MITCNLKGGLGNYMFQIAATYGYAIENCVKPVFDFDVAMKVHEDINTYKSNILRNVDIDKGYADVLYREPSFGYTRIPYLMNGDVYLDGYFQSEKYFFKYSEQIKKLFTEPEDIKKYIDNKYGDIFQNICSIHIRRSNYKDIQQFHPLMTMEYYKNAMSNFDGKFLVFSDDMEWCREKFIGENFIFSDNEEDYVDLYLMSRCDNNIIANSTFSWWGAWLNNNPNKKVIAPENWFGPALNHDTSDLIPKDWIVC